MYKLDSKFKNIILLQKDITDDELKSFTVSMYEQCEAGLDIIMGDILILPENYIDDYIVPLFKLTEVALSKIEKHTGAE